MMNNLSFYLKQSFTSNTSLVVLSSPILSDYEKRITFNNICTYFQREDIRNNKAFHLNLTFQECFDFVHDSLINKYQQFNSWDSTYEYSIKITKKGKILYLRKPTQRKALTPQHDREKSTLLNLTLMQNNKLQSILKKLCILTPDGKIINSKQNKFRQINRFIEIVYDEIKNWDKTKSYHLVDFGCGKSYLTFFLYHFLTDTMNYQLEMTGIDSNPEIIEKISAESVDNKLNFICSDISHYKSQKPVDIVISLHACDTATDHVLKFAIEHDVKAVFAVPCCQHELNSQIKSDTYPLITKYGLLKERFSALVTDAFRANILDYFGYRTQLIDFVDLESTAKNVLIRAVKGNISNKKRQTILSEIEKFIQDFGISPTLYSLIKY